PPARERARRARRRRALPEPQRTRPARRRDEGLPGGVNDRVAAWDEAPSGLLVLAPDGTVLDANRTFLRWVGQPAEEVVGRVRLSRLLSVGGRIYRETHLPPLLHVEGRVEEVALALRGPAGLLPV